MAGITLSELLKKMIEMGGSDLHLSTNSPPRIRVHGKLRPLDMPPLTAADTKALAYSVLTDAQKHRLEESLELDFSFGLKSLARFRGNLFHQRGAVAAVFRTIPWEIKGFEAKLLPGLVGHFGMPVLDPVKNGHFRLILCDEDVFFQGFNPGVAGEFITAVDALGLRR